MARHTQADDGNTFVGIVGDDVAIIGAGTADDRVGARNVDAVVTVAYAGGAAASGADPVAGDRYIVGAGHDVDAVGTEARNHQAANCAVVGSGADADAVGHDVVAVDANQRRTGVAGLRARIERCRARQRRQHGGQRNRLYTRCGNIERDRVGTCIAISADDRRAKGACAGVIGIGHGVGGEDAVPTGAYLGA